MDIARRQVKALSNDGQIITTIWEWLKQGFAAVKNGSWYVGREKDVEDAIIPATTSDIVEELGANSFSTKKVRGILWGLSLAGRDLPQEFRVGTKRYKGIWFEPRKLDRLLADFVIDYTLGDIEKVLPVQTVKQETLADQKLQIN